MIKYLLFVALSYLIVYLFWSTIKPVNSLTDKIIFCSTCATFFSIFAGLYIYFLFTGIQVINLALLFGLSLTGGAYSLQGAFDRLKEKKKNLKDNPYKNTYKEIAYKNRLFIFELTLLIIGLIIIEKGGFS